MMSRFIYDTSNDRIVRHYQLAQDREGRTQQRLSNVQNRLSEALGTLNGEQHQEPVQHVTGAGNGEASAEQLQTFNHLMHRYPQHLDPRHLDETPQQMSENNQETVNA
jgi:hypothetical protein